MMTQPSVWTTRGFEAFSQGACGNGGHNLYVSRAGVLQRIHQCDLDGDGYLDLIFCNSQNHWERTPTYVVKDALGRREVVELPAEGPRDAIAVDLNGNGYDDLVLAFENNGVREDLNSVIYFGCEDGLSEKYQQHLPTPGCTSVAAGDFRGAGMMDIVFVCGGKPRLFQQDEVGFEPKRFVDLPIEAEQVFAAVFDGTSAAALLVRTKSGKVDVYRGGAGGLDLDHPIELPVAFDPPPVLSDEQRRLAEYEEAVFQAKPRLNVLRIDDVPHVFVARASAAYLVPVEPEFTFGEPVQLQCNEAMAAAVGDINGNGQTDLVIACRDKHDDHERSWVYWGEAGSFSDERRTSLNSRDVVDVAMADLDGNGCDDIVLCQTHDGENFTTDSLIYRGGREGITEKPVAVMTHEAQRVVIARPSAKRDPQIVFANHYSRCLIGDVPVYIYHGGPDGYSTKRRSQRPGWSAVESLCCDLHDNGRPDLVIANCAENAVWLDPGSYVYYNGPDGLPLEPSLKLPTVRAHGVACADLNRNGYLDLIFGGIDHHELQIFHGTAEGFDIDNPTTVLMEYEGKRYTEPRWLYLADLNNNGWLDLVVPQCMDDRSFVLWGGPQGFSMERAQPLHVRAGVSVRAADLTGNGYLDLIIGGLTPTFGQPHDSFVYIYWNGPDGLREDRRQQLPAYHVNSMAVADFNNDGLLDLFFCSYHDGRERDIPSYLYWNRPGRGFSSRDFTRLFTRSASGCMAGDFNEDGYIDLAVANHKTDGDHVGESCIFWNGPDGFDSGRVTLLPTMGPHGMTCIGPGNIMDRGPEEYYTAAAHQLPAGHRITRINWEAQVPAKTWVKAQLRFAQTESVLDRAPWLGPNGTDTWFDKDTPVPPALSTGPWVQYRLALGAVNSVSTPRVTEVHVHHGGG